MTIERAVKNGHENMTTLERVLQLHGQFKRSLEHLRVTPLQAGVISYLHRHADAKLTDAAATLGVRLPTLSVVVTDLVRKRWVTKRRSVTDTRAVCLSLSWQGQALVRRIKDHVRDVRSDRIPRKEVSS
jgi:DNA-binding MarR family transcriptional regulator